MNTKERIQSLKVTMEDALHDLGRIGKQYGPESIEDWWVTVKYELARLKMR